MRTYEIWSEGYVASGNIGHAMLICEQEGESFRDACYKASFHGKFNGLGTLDLENLTLWGCKLFDNQQDAMKKYG